MKNSFENILKTSERKLKLVETDDGKEFVQKILSDFFTANNIRRYTLYLKKSTF